MAVADAKVPWWLTNLGDAEIRAVAEAIRGRHVNPGPLCRELERMLAETLGLPHVVLTTSGSMALLLAMLACGLRPGDEVVLPAGAFIAPAHAALLRGARARLADVRADRPVLDPAALAGAVTDRTRIIVPVHLNGAASDMQAVNAAARRAGAKVVEDCAQAFCSRGPEGLLGTLSDAAAFSMGITKLITTGEGGFVATRDDATADRLRKLRNHGVDNIADNVFDGFGFNFRFNDIQAAVGLAQLRRLPEKIASVRRVHSFYRDRLRGLHYIRMMDVRDGEVPLWAEALCAERETVIRELASRGIQAKAFHPSLSRSPHLDCAGDFPHAEFFAAHGLILPSGTDQPEENLRSTADALREIAGLVRTPLEA